MAVSETSKGGALLYIADHFDPLTKLNKIMYKSNMLESIFVEICNEKMLLLVVFTNTFLWTSMNSMSFFNLLLATDNKKLFLVRDFNIDLLNVDTTIVFYIITANLLVHHNKNFIFINNPN